MNEPKTFFPEISNNYLDRIFDAGGDIYRNEKQTILVIQLRQYFDVFFSAKRNRNIFSGTVRIKYLLN